MKLIDIFLRGFPEGCINTKTLIEDHCPAEFKSLDEYTVNFEQICDSKCEECWNLEVE